MGRVTTRGGWVDCVYCRFVLYCYCTVALVGRVGVVCNGRCRFVEGMYTNTQSYHARTDRQTDGLRGRVTSVSTVSAQRTCFLAVRLPPPATDVSLLHAGDEAVSRSLPPLADGPYRASTAISTSPMRPSRPAPFGAVWGKGN